jgi:hypothetical protein
LYQAKLSEQLMIPYPPPTVTLKNIEKMFISGNAQLIVNNDAVSEYVAIESPVLSKSMKTLDKLSASLRKKIESDGVATFLNENTVWISSEGAAMAELNKITPAECANYVYVTLDEWRRAYSALILRNERVDILESMNFIVAERMSYVNDYIQSFQLTEECRKHIFPIYEPNPKFESLPLLKITGALAFLFLFLCISVFVLIAEIISSKRRDPKMATGNEFQTFQIHWDIDDTFSSDKRREIFAKYLELIEIIHK